MTVAHRHALFVLTISEMSTIFRDSRTTGQGGAATELWLLALGRHCIIERGGEASAMKLLLLAWRSGIPVRDFWM
jgi:hypothetical protein